MNSPLRACGLFQLECLRQTAGKDMKMEHGEEKYKECDWREGVRYECDAVGFAICWTLQMLMEGIRWLWLSWQLIGKHQPSRSRCDAALCGRMRLKYVPRSNGSTGRYILTARCWNEVDRHKLFVRQKSRTKQSLFRKVSFWLLKLHGQTYSVGQWTNRKWRTDHLEDATVHAGQIYRLQGICFESSGYCTLEDLVTLATVNLGQIWLSLVWFQRISSREWEDNKRISINKEVKDRVTENWQRTDLFTPKLSDNKTIVLPTFS